MVENIPMNTRQIKIFVVLIFCALGFAANVNAAARKPAGNPAQQKAQAEKPQKRTYPWTIKTIDDMYNEDAANFSRYAKDNAELKKAPVAVFMGDSITDAWAKVRPNFFSENNYVGRGISGQVTSQMLVRFRNDVLALKPQVVLILAGTNDVARNRGYIAEENVVGNVISMCEIAKANSVKPIICSILPASSYRWRPQIKSVESIAKINAMLKDYAQKNSILYLDYFSKLANAQKGLDPDMAKDGVHPTAACYAIMEKMAKEAVESQLGK